MASPAYAEAHDTFGRYALRFVAKQLAPLSADDITELASMVRAADAFLAEAGVQTDPSTPDFLQLCDEVRALRSGVARVLAVAGLDASWERNAQHVVLDAEDSAFIADLLRNPPEPNDTFAEAAEDYKSFVGL
jgi:hypothetical protein